MFSFLFKKKKDNSDTKILIVEDNHVDRKLLEKTLEREGFKMVFAENGEEGLSKAKETSPDLIILDCEMPIMSGNEMCKRLKEDNDLMDTPVIFLTSINTPKNIIDCFELDAESYLNKPVKPKVLLRQIEDALKNKQVLKKG